jgi:hypothetical protein
MIRAGAALRDLEVVRADDAFLQAAPLERASARIRWNGTLTELLKSATRVMGLRDRGYS